MTPYLDDGDVRLYLGDAIDVLRGMPDESVHMAVTSPPFYGLRSYLPDGHPDKTSEVGLEASPQEWCDRLVNVFRGGRRGLRRDGTLWVECGDSYATSQFTRQGNPRNVPQAANGYAGEDWTSSRADAYAPHRWDVANLKPKDQLLAPHLLAAALRDDGWYLRSTIIWAKPNPMPESVTDRPTSAHAYVFLLAKQARYFYDQEAVREPHDSYLPMSHFSRQGNKESESRMNSEARNLTFTGPREYNPAGRNARSVWTIPTEPNGLAVCANPDCQGYWQREAPREHCGLPVVQHYAAFPRELVRRCILAGTSEYGCCPECGAPWEREVGASGGSIGRDWNERRDHGKNDLAKGQQARRETTDGTYKREMIGWRPPCDCCYAEEIGLPPAGVLDPFAGSGTPLVVARQHGRHAIGIDLSEPYARMPRHRLSQQSLLARRRS